MTKSLECSFILKILLLSCHVSKPYAVFGKPRGYMAFPWSSARGYKPARELPEFSGRGFDMASVCGGWPASPATYLLFCRRSKGAVSHS